MNSSFLSIPQKTFSASCGLTQTPIHSGLKLTLELAGEKFLETKLQRGTARFFGTVSVHGVKHTYHLQVAHGLHQPKKMKKTS
jgi:hypothetical protein